MIYEWIMKSWMKVHVNEFHLSVIMFNIGICDIFLGPRDGFFCEIELCFFEWD